MHILIISDQHIMLLFLLIMLCCNALKLKFTYNVQEQELLSDYYAFYMQFCMNNSLQSRHVANYDRWVPNPSCLSQTVTKLPYSGFFFEGENFHELILLTFFAVKFSRMPLTEITMIASYR